jgi:hypothetical protein
MDLPSSGWEYQVQDLRRPNKAECQCLQSVGGKKGCHQMTDDCTENHLIRAIGADDALTDELIAMVRHTGCPDDKNLREARYDLATEFIHSDAVYAALKLAPRARRARLNTLWREWQNKFQTPEGRAEEKAVLEEMKKAEEQIAGGEP